MMTGNSRNLRDALHAVEPVYEVPDDDLVGEVLIPALTVADKVQVGSGFFSSQSLAQLAPGLAAFLTTSQGKIYLLLSPEISEEDRNAITRGIQTPERVIERISLQIFQEADINQSALVKHTLDCLSYLVATRRLDIRFVLMKQGMFHKKEWIFHDGKCVAAVHGSGNVTASGLLVNGEQMTVDRPWLDGYSAQRRVAKLADKWTATWENQTTKSITLSAMQCIEFLTKRGSKPRPPTVEEFWQAWREDYEAGLEPVLPPKVILPPKRLRVPSGLDWRTGKYEHQGRAVDRFLGNHGRGILAIATGGGKTKTALIAATELQEQHHGPLVVLVLVPSKPLMLQWANDIASFGIDPFLPSIVEQGARRERIRNIQLAIASHSQRTEVIICTNKLAASDAAIADLLTDLPAESRLLLIGDEVHNLGAPTYRTMLPERAQYRLGLSATPIRQYDPDGTDELFDYFGEQIFQFDLDQAISQGCLTPYDYHLHEVELVDEEMDKWKELSEKLARAGFTGRDQGQTIVSGSASRSRLANKTIEKLLRERRAVVEQAHGKVDRLKDILVEQGASNIRRCLIYTSAKSSAFPGPRQIEQVNALLADLGILSHQYTNAETSNARSRSLLEAFRTGKYQALTAMKVLDEGIDIPQTDTAFILASSTVRREWVQRRGRILRTSPGKDKATLHDFLVIPPRSRTGEGRSLLRSELERAEEFAGLASNEWSSDGPRAVIQRWESVAWSEPSEAGGV